MQKALLICFLLLGSFSFAQKYSFVTFSTEEGLPQTQVTAVTQGDHGYLWIGTLGGLARFNGRDFVTYSSDNGLWNNRVKTLAYFDGKIWVGHDGGVSIIDGNSVSGIGFEGDDQSRHSVEILKFKNRVIVCTADGGLFNYSGNKLTKFKEVDRIRGAYVHNETLYLATRHGVLQTNDLKDFRELPELQGHSVSGATGQGNELMFTTYESLIFTIDTKTNRIDSTSLDSLRILGGYIDRDMCKWLNTDYGVLRIDQDGHQMLIDENRGLPANMISCFYQDHNGTIWIGSKGKGLFRFPGINFQYYDRESGIQSDLFLNGFQEPDGTFVLGSYDRGVIYWKPGGDVELVDVGESVIWASIRNVDGRDWFGAQSSMISIDAAGNKTYYVHPDDEIPGSKITSFYKIDANSMYIGGNEGVALYKNGKFKKLGKRDSEFMGTVRDIEVVNGVIYCASNLGLFKYVKGDFYPVQGADKLLYSIEPDENGNLWIGAEEGLFVMKGGKLKRIPLNDNAGSNFINFINYSDGKLFVGTNNGFFMLSNLNGNVKAERFGKGDGVPSLETNLNSGFFDREGNFWFGTAAGLVKFNTSISRAKLSNPVLNLKSILLNYEDFDFSKYSDEVDEKGIPQDMVLPYNKNNLIFILDGVSLLHQSGLRYQFKLEGLSDNWSPLSEVSTITFTSLPAGTYKLRLRAVDVDGRKSEEVEINFVIKEAFYKTWWFIALCILSAILIALLIFRMRLRRIEEKNEKEKLVFKTRLLALEQKSVNASMNRHFIFNALNSIQYFINTQDRVSANKYLTNFAKLIRKNLDTASWDENMISLEEELERLRLYLSLESMRFSGRFEYEIKTHDIDLESIKIPAMMIQPFLENSIIHGILPNEGIEGKILVDLQVHDGILHVLIEDNGIGVNQSLSQKSDMEGDHRSQGTEITSKRIELIRELSGNIIELQGPKEIVGDDSSINGTRVLIKIQLPDLEN